MLHNIINIYEIIVLSVINTEIIHLLKYIVININTHLYNFNILESQGK